MFTSRFEQTCGDSAGAVPWTVSWRPEGRAWSRILLILAISLFQVGCTEKKAEAPKRPTAVKTVVAEVTELSSTVSLTGEIKARSQSDLAFRFAGRVASRLAEVGQRVSAGQVLATLDTTQQDAGIAAAKAGVQAAQANVAQTTSTFERQRSLLQSGYTTQARYGLIVKLRNAWEARGASLQAWPAI